MLWFTLALALAGKPYELVMTIENEDGAPVTSAVVQFADEGSQTHPVHGVHGTWMGDGLSLPTGVRVLFAKGQVIEWNVSAEGYQDQQVEALIARRSTQIVVTLVPETATE